MTALFGAHHRARALARRTRGDAAKWEGDSHFQGSPSLD
jgi:hypothetical protein